jgi:very-short-patch-repair endonuclease
MCGHAATASSLEGVAQERQKLHAVMTTFGPVLGDGPIDVGQTSLSLPQLRQNLNLLCNLISKLLPWANFLRTEDRVAELGVATLVKGARRTQMSVEALLLAFNAAVAFQEAKRFWQADSQLVSFSGAEFNDLRGRFAQEDRNKLQQNQAYVVQQIVQRVRSVPASVDAQRPVTPVMKTILTNESSKQRKHWPVRKLVENTGPLMQQLCPCWLMTPLAVAQFLKPGAVQFDLVIMDEASQLPPEDAWGVIARGKQLVVVGDPKQMPPSDFFSSSSGEEDESEDELELDGAKLDSILDTAKNCMRQSDLLWHYRSRHQSLIAPANRFSYGDRLILFPSAYDRHDHMGVRHTFVENAVATAGRGVLNAKEAAAVVERLVEIALVEQKKDSKERFSVGVIAMNQRQMDCIQDLLDAKRRSSSTIDRAVASLEENTSEPLLVMNLENVQGDQRDIILISYTYAPTALDTTLRNDFGPINRDGGERRFNVLITRAKWRMEVFSSIRSDQIQISDKKPGVHHFYHFLKYAETGQLVDPGATTLRDPDSPFEEHVISVLRQSGYDVEPQVGVAGYFIDLAIRHPRDRDRFIIGIECDGATYHSSRSARDRDRLRENVLRDRGWSLYRIWSTDWFTNNQSARDDLLATVAKVCKEAEESINGTRSYPIGK